MNSHIRFIIVSIPTFFVSNITLLAFSQPQIYAQIKVDSRTFTRKSVEGSKSIINGGIESKNFVLHQFRDFNVRKDSSVLFLNPNAKSTIISNVIGRNSSNISGILETSGNANLIFINPNGINFLENASLNINGSFFASTADEFDIKKNKLILDYTNNKSVINIQGDGHNLIFSGNSRLPQFFNKKQSNGLATAPGNSISLISGRINFDGGVVTAQSGTVNLFAIKNGSVEAFETSKGLSVLPLANELNDIFLQNRAFVNTSGNEQGSIIIKAKEFKLSDASLIYAKNTGSKALGIISIDVGDLVIDGITARTPLFPSTFDAYARGISSDSDIAAGPKIRISANSLTLINQGLITTHADGSSNGANVNIDVKETITLEGATPFNPFLPFGSSVSSLSRGKGKAGNITVSSRNLIIKNGANIQSAVLNSGDSGDIIIKSDNIFMSGFTPVSNIPSIISNIAIGNPATTNLENNEDLSVKSRDNLKSQKSGSGGRLSIRSKQLKLTGGARIDASTLSDGQSGSIDINTDSVSVSGKIPGDESSQITSSSNNVNQFLKNGLGLDQPTGNSGSVSINANTIKLFDSGSINVRSDGTGNAGVVTISADKLNISSQGNISASTNGGTGGNIVVDADLLTLTDGTISSSARGTGEGGNISIKSIFTALNQGSIVEANAENAQAGRIEIETNTLSTNRDARVSTTSQLGPQFDGTVQAIVENSQAIQPVSLIPAAEPISTISQICGYSGNSISQQDKASEDEIVTDPTLIKAFALKQRYESTKNLLYRHQDTGEVEQIRPLLAVEQINNGKVKFIYDPNESNNASNLLSFLERKCQSYHKS